MKQFGWAAVAAGLLMVPSAQAQLAPAAVSGELRLAGSNTIGSQLAPDLLAAYGKQSGLTAVKVEETADPEEHNLVMGAAESERHLRATVAAHGSGTAFPALAEGHADIGMASRPITDAEAVMLEKAGIRDKAAAGNTYVLSLDGVVVLVHRNNAIGLLTIDQIHRLFSGQITNWSALGGRDLPVTIYSRDSKSGTSDTFRSLALGNDRIAASAKLFESSEDLADSVAADESGIGFVGFAYSRNAKPVTVALPCGITVEPKPFYVRSEEYPLSRRLFFYTPDKKSPLVQDFLRFSLSDAAQPIVEQAGFINLAPELGEAGRGLPGPGVADPTEDRRRLAVLSGITHSLAGARRLSTTFRFEFDSFTLDARALADVARVAAWRRANPGGKLTLVGYSSAQGPFDYNLALAARRAQTVANALAGAGTTPNQVLAGSTLGPVACNDDPSHGGLNRRVEVWLQ